MLKACIQPIRFAQVGVLDIWLDDSRQCRNFFLRSFWSRIYDSPNNIVSAFGSKKERKIHSNNRRNGCIILAIIADVLALRCTLDSTCMPRVCSEYNVTKSLFLLFIGWICRFWGSTAFNQQFPFPPTTNQKANKQYQNHLNISQSSETSLFSYVRSASDFWARSF